MVDHVLEPREVRVACRRQAILPSHIVLQLVRAPVREIEGRIRQNIVCPHGRMAVVEEGIGRIGPEIRLNPPNRKVHLGHFPGGRIGVLSVNGNVINISTVVFDKFCGLYEHTAAAAARVIAPWVWFS